VRVRRLAGRVRRPHQQRVVDFIGVALTLLTSRDGGKSCNRVIRVSERGVIEIT
jgi:hypothetical protein